METFSQCESLQSIILPKGVYSLEATFMGCTSLQSVTIQEGASDFCATFDDCISLETVYLPEDIPYIPQFSHCYNLKDIYFAGTKCAWTGLKKGTTCVFRIRCQKTNKDRGRTWSQYSAWKKCVVK